MGNFKKIEFVKGLNESSSLSSARFTRDSAQIKKNLDLLTSIWFNIFYKYKRIILLLSHKELMENDISVMSVQTIDRF